MFFKARNKARNTKVMRQTHHKHLFNIFFIIIIRGEKGKEMEWRGGRRDGRGDGTVCEGIVPLGDQWSGKAEGFGKVFVSHPVPSHGKFGKNEEGWRGPPIRNERDKLRGLNQYHEPLWCMSVTRTKAGCSLRGREPPGPSSRG